MQQFCKLLAQFDDRRSLAALDLLRFCNCRHMWMGFQEFTHTAP
jgi:hypothetical protein